MIKMKVLGLRVEFAETGFQKIRGLMFRRKLGHALWFKLSKKMRLGAGIHSYFVFFKFDIVWLDGNKIIDLRRNVKPFTLNVSPKKPCDSFLELPAGTIKKHKLKIGRILRF